MDMGSRWAGVIVLAVAGLVGGFLYGRRVAPAATDDPTPHTARDRVTGEGRPPGALATGDAEVDTLRARVAELEGRVQQHEKLASAYEEELYGVPIPWPEQVEERYTEAGFRARVERAVETCEIEVDLLGFDCEELPCLMVVRVQEYDALGRLFSDCPAWSEHYGPVTSGFDTSVECPDGSEERISMRGIPVETVLGHDPADDGYDVMKRLMVRGEQRVLTWQCAGEE